MNESKFGFKELFNSAVIVAALGYFVDVYDLVLFLVIGVSSLIDIGVSEANKIAEFQYLLNIQICLLYTSDAADE